jgi:hypothetical protein
MQCYYCCKRGHMITECKLRERARKLCNYYLKDKKAPKDDTAVNAAIATTAEDANEATISDASIWACYTSIPKIKEQENSFQKAWHLDSGATDHICNDKGHLLDIRRLPKPIQVRIGDNSIVPVAGIGTVLAASKNRRIQLTDILYVPAIGTNLLSVSKLTDKGCEVQFSKNGQATILNPKDQSIATTYRKSSMYEVQVSSCFLTRNNVRIQRRKKATRPLPIELWHHRLGHLNHTDMRKLTDMATGIRIRENQDQKLCIPCLKGKMHRKYNRTSTRSSKKLELIHSDLCGPFPIRSISKSVYFIIFIDDATRMTWVYFLKSKAFVENEAESSIHRFKARLVIRGFEQEYGID